jgi:hypothetical protein
MKFRTLLFLLVLAAIAAFVALNWSAIMTPTTLSLGVAVVQAPLGLIMLGLLAFLTALFLIFVVYLQTSVLLEARRHSRELQANRELADQAEASRFTELRGFLEAELKTQAGIDAESRATVLARLDQLDRDIRSAVEQSGTTLSAYIGELEDRLERGARGPTPQPPA